jgi:hypothetical protein
VRVGDTLESSLIFDVRVEKKFGHVKFVALTRVELNPTI